LSIMNLAWDDGAISSSPLAMLAMRTSHVSLLLYVVGVLGVVLAIVLLRMPFLKKPHEENSASGTTDDKTAGTGVAILLGVLFFVYVGTEVGTSYWASTHTQRAMMWSSNTWALAPMFFFAGLLGGRGAAAAILLHLKEVTVAVGGLLLAVMGESFFLAGHTPLPLFGGAFLAGLGLASIFPILIAWLSKWYGTRARKVGGVMFALAALGSALMPPLVGVASRYGGSLRIGLLVPLAGCAVMLALIGILRPGTRG
jgi:fucose permease